MKILYLIYSILLVILFLHLIKKPHILFKSYIWFGLTVILGLIFIFIQYREWSDISIAATSRSLMSRFYRLTGLHGSHVLVGLIWLLTIFFITRSGKARILRRHIFIISGIWYWHFVDLIWLFVYTFVYFWPTI